MTSASFQAPVVATDASRGSRSTEKWVYAKTLCARKTSVKTVRNPVFTAAIAARLATTSICGTWNAKTCPAASSSVISASRTPRCASSAQRTIGLTS